MCIGEPSAPVRLGFRDRDSSRVLCRTVELGVGRCWMLNVGCWRLESYKLKPRPSHQHQSVHLGQFLEPVLPPQPPHSVFRLVSLQKQLLNPLACRSPARTSCCLHRLSSPPTASVEQRLHTAQARGLAEAPATSSEASKAIHMRRLLGRF